MLDYGCLISSEAGARDKNGELFYFISPSVFQQQLNANGRASIGTTQLLSSCNAVHVFRAFILTNRINHILPRIRRTFAKLDYIPYSIKINKLSLFLRLTFAARPSKSKGAKTPRLRNFANILTHIAPITLKIRTVHAQTYMLLVTKYQGDFCASI